ncbi:hypothetical protein [Stenotrophomonas sp.]|uniref:hypothetical protein n=1 Tax=Stenotrophomonas sp. TaxID=69392 RepID=UPI0028B0FED1|nr:hypothetical protein [Stenotrophomonas sp.]
MPAKSLKYIKPYHDARLNTLLRFTESDDPKALKKAINVLRTGVWFEELRLRLGQSTAYGLGQQLQPDTYRQGLHHHNMWAKYAAGKHLPGQETVRACELAAPHSSDLLLDAGWDLLDASRPIGQQGDTLLRQLRPSIQNAIFDERALAAGRYERRRAPIQPLRRLEGQADLQALAATVVLLREASEAGDRSRAFEVGVVLHRILLMAVVGTRLRWIAPELFEFFIRQIFPLAAGDEVTLQLDRNVLGAQSQWLNRTILEMEDAGWCGYIPGGTTRQLRRLLSVDYGFDLLFGLSPRLKLAVPSEQASEDARRWVGWSNAAWDWATSVLDAGRRESLMPDDVIAQMAAARG